jgi:hypothetical protein
MAQGNIRKGIGILKAAQTEVHRRLVANPNPHRNPHLKVDNEQDYD